MYFRRKTSGGRAYLQIVESRREGDPLRQQVVATIIRMDELRGSGELERLLRSGARFAPNALVLSGAEDAVKVVVRRIGHSAGVRTAVGGNRLPPAVLSDLSGARSAGARGVPHRAASPVRERLRAGGGSLAGGVRDHRRARARSARSLSGDGVARGRAFGEGPRRSNAVRAVRQGRCRGTVVRASPRPIHAARPGVSEHNQPVWRRGGSAATATARTVGQACGR
jgi:hypothetical protein